MPDEPPPRTEDERRPGADGDVIVTPDAAAAAELRDRSQRAQVRAPTEIVEAAAAAPTTVPALAGIAVCVALSTRGAGFPLSAWAPAALAFGALLIASAWALRGGVGGAPRPVVVAVAALGGYTAWSFLSITWASDKGEAWLGADRTLLYLIVFALFALWRQRPETAAVVAGVWTLAMALLALLVVVQLTDPGGAQRLFSGGRLGRPADYPNAAAAVWLMAVWPAVALAASRSVPIALRGVLAGAAVVLVDIGVLAQSRGGALAVAAVLIISFAAFPGRVRRLATLVPIAIAVAAASSQLLDLAGRISDGTAVGSALSGVRRTILLEALLVGLVVAAGAIVERRAELAPELEHRLHRAAGAAALAVAIAGALAAIAIGGGPAHIADRAWSSFKGGYATNKATGAHLVSGLGSNRYDFYRVGLDVFAHHPFAGVGADNFAEDYLVHGRSDETPRYPHSFEIRTLQQTGLIGAALLLAALGAAAVAVWRAARAWDGRALLVVTATAGPMLYWLAHGSVDWLWETTGLGAAAFALLGLACALAPREEPALRPAPRAWRTSRDLRRRRARVAATVTLALLALYAFGAPWIADRQTDQAARTWPAAPARAYAKLGSARGWNPLSTRAQLIEGAIAIQLGDLRRADRAFAAALARDDRSSFALLQRGAIASRRGDRAAAVRLLASALRLAPRDAITRDALTRARAGQRLSPRAIDAELARGASRFAGG